MFSALLQPVAVGAQVPKTAKEFFQLGSKQFATHRFTDAKEAFGQAIELDARFGEAYRALGMTDLELKDYDGAYHAWLKAVDCDGKDEKSKYFLGRLFYEADFPNEAARWLREALQLAPDDYQAITYLGLAAEALGFEDTALQLYRKAIAESASQGKPYAAAFLSLGELLKKQGKEDQALAVLERGALASPEAHELAAFGELLAAHHAMERAEAVLRQAIALDPALAQPHYRLALLLKGLGREEESRTEMAKFQDAKNKEQDTPKILALRR